MFLIQFIFLFSLSSFAVCPNESAIHRLYDWAVEATAHLQVPESKMIQVPCGLEHALKNQQIIFVGENHGSQNSISAKNRIFEAAKQGKVEVMTEVGLGYLALPWLKQSEYFEYPELKSENIHGIESHVPASVSVSYVTQLELLTEPTTKNIHSSIAATSQYQFTMPLIARSIEQLKKKPQTCQRCVEIIDAIQKVDFKTKKELIAQYNDVSEKEWLKFFTQLHHEIILTAKTKYSDAWKKHGIELINLDDLKKIKQYTDLNNGNKLDRQLVKMRSIDMAQQIVNQICAREKQPNSKPLVIVTGKHHTYDMYPILFALSHKSFHPKIYETEYENQSSAMSKLLTSLK